MQYLWERTGAFARKYPCIVAFIAVLSSMAGYLAAPSSAWPAVLFPLYAALAAAFLCLPLRDACLRFALPGLLGACSLFFHMRSTGSDDLTELLSGAPDRCTIRVEAADSSLAPGIGFLPPAKTAVLRVTALRKPSGEWIHVSARIRGTLPADMAAGTGYGDTLELTGIFIRPDPVPGEVLFNYREYLRQHQIRYLFFASEGTLLHRSRAPGRLLLDMRDSLLDRLCAGLQEEEVQRLAPGVLFGIRRGIKQETKQDFINSGMVHILSVSGTHVMLAAGLFWLLFCLLPYRWRSLAVVLFTFLYAESTGMQEPAFRAFLMFALLSVFRAFHLRSLSLNTLFLAAVILTLRDPATLLSSGFQFSFLAVMALLLGMDAIRRLFFQPSEDMLLIPSVRLTKSIVRRTVRSKFLISAVGGCVIAWLVSLPLTLLYQAVWPGASIFANLLILPLNFLIFGVFLTGCCFFYIPGVPALVSWLLSWLFRGMCGVAAWGTDFGLAVPSPHPALAVLFLILFFIMLTAKDLRIAVPAGLAVAAFTIGLFFMSFGRTPYILLVTNGSRISVCAADPASGIAVVPYLDDPSAAWIMSSIFRTDGIRCIREMSVVPETKDAQKARNVLTGKFPLFRTPAVKTDRESGMRFLKNETFRAGLWESRLAFETELPDGRMVTGLIRRERDGGFYWYGSAEGCDLPEVRLPAASDLRVYRYPLPHP